MSRRHTHTVRKWALEHAPKIEEMVSVGTLAGEETLCVRVYTSLALFFFLFGLFLRYLPRDDDDDSYVVWASRCSIQLHQSDVTNWFANSPARKKKRIIRVLTIGNDVICVLLIAGGYNNS